MNMKDKRATLKEIIKGKLTRQEARKQLSPESLHRGCVICWGNGTYSISGRGPMTEAQALEVLGADSMDGHVHIAFGHGQHEQA